MRSNRRGRFMPLVCLLNRRFQSVWRSRRRTAICAASNGVIGQGAGALCLVGGGHVERLDCNLAQDDPGEREGDAGRRVVEMGEHQEVPSVEANRVQGFV